MLTLDAAQNWTFYVPANVQFESSVPRFLWWLWSPDDPDFLRPAMFHDQLLERGVFPALADSQWLAVALADGAPILKTRIAHNWIRKRRFFLWVWSVIRP